MIGGVTVLQKQKDLDPTTLKGKKLRTEGFYQALGISILLVLFPIPFHLLGVLEDARLLVTIICALELPIFLIVTIGCYKKIFFVITEDTLYFFRAEAELRNDSDSRKKTHYHGSGRVPLSEIRSMKVTYLYPHSKRRTPRLVLEGEGFTITDTGEGKYAMWSIRKAQESFPRQTPQVPTPIPPSPLRRISLLLPQRKLPGQACLPRSGRFLSPALPPTSSTKVSP